MTGFPEHAPQPEPDALERAADEAIAACGGDMRGAIRALIVANEYLETEIKELMVAVSKGYARGRHHEAPTPLPRERKDWYD